eukprot:4913977-Pyramimonas_sp.AAC.1
MGVRAGWADRGRGWCPRWARPPSGQEVLARARGARVATGAARACGASPPGTPCSPMAPWTSTAPN